MCNCLLQTTSTKLACQWWQILLNCKYKTGMPMMTYSAEQSVFDLLNNQFIVQDSVKLQVQNWHVNDDRFCWIASTKLAWQWWQILLNNQFLINFSFASDLPRSQKVVKNWAPWMTILSRLNTVSIAQIFTLPLEIINAGPEGAFYGLYPFFFFYISFSPSKSAHRVSTCLVS